MAQKKKNTKTNKKKSKIKKAKVYIPAYKIIISCAVIITICMGLLLFTTLTAPSADDSVSLSKEFKEKAEDKKSETIIEEKKADDSTPAKKTVEKKESAKPKTEQAKPVQKKEEAKKLVPVEPSPKKSVEAKEPAKKEPEKQEPAVKPVEKKASKYDFPEAKKGAQLIFVFDDGGQNLNHLKEFLKLPFPITIAVLPQIVHSKESAAQVRASGHELILHQPMQSVSANVNPGPGAIKPEMSESEIKSVLFQNVTEIGPIAGMNNHEGSAITADAEKMAVVMQFCSQEGIYFLDSRTNVETKVPYVAGELGYSYYERNIFLDNEKTNANALKELKKGLDLANKNGSVIMIGHVWSADFLPAFLQDVYPELKEKGYTFSTVSKSKARKN